MRATVFANGHAFTGEVYHTRENGWPCVECDDGHIASGPRVDSTSELDKMTRQWLIGCDRVTLDGHPATVSGTSLPFAIVRRLDGRGGSVEYAWPTVAHIIDNGGRFES